jgi:F-type H+-transporting ATPase subunit epsilon
MKLFKLKIITPKKIVRELEIKSLTVPSVTGELTVLHNHVPLMTLLTHGICKIEFEKTNETLAVGGGYLEVTGKEVNLLVSEAYGQDEVDEKKIKEAQEHAKTLLSIAKTDEERHEAMLMMKRSTIDLKLLRKTKRY